MKHHPRTQNAAALVIVLASLILLTILVMAFLSSVGTELRSSKAYSDGSNAKLLAQSCINLALAQIRDATSGTKGNDTVAWASQPGMIRTYDTSGAPANYYKLFSWTGMTGEGTFNPTLPDNSIPENWSQLPAIFTDLNEPLLIPGKTTNELAFPIVDGNGLQDGGGGSKTYLSEGAPAVDGFSIGPDAPVETDSTYANPVPMPVKWLYILEKGEVVAPVISETGTEAKVDGATASNPIVGRIAFWTDDESCKININTAAEGTYTDMPRMSFINPQESLLAKNQPVQGEYQRYPGHPATTALSTVLKKTSATMADTAWAERIYDWAPRIRTGGSREGTLVTAMGGAAISAITPDADRLYASIDELAFKPAVSGLVREQNDNTSLNKTNLPRARFFLTPFSRSPDVNLYNKPRVSIWPIYKQENAADAAYLTAFDKLMAFCTRINGRLYSFQRQDSNHPQNDLPANSGTTGLQRNRSLLEYLRNLAGSNIPGFGGNFRAKYGSGTDQLLTEIFDYIRCTNLADSTLADPAKRFTKVKAGAASPNFPGLGQVVPIEDTTNATRGFGRFRTVQGTSILFIANADGDVPDSQRDQSGAMLANPAKVAPGFVRVQAMFLLQLFDPSVGSVFNNPNFRISVTGLNGLKWGTNESSLANMNFAGASNTYAMDRYPIDGAFYGDQFGINQIANTTWTTNYIAASIDLPKSGGRFRFNGAASPLQIKLLSSTGTTLQTVNITLPDATLPLPQIGPLTVVSQDPGWSSNKIAYFRYFKDRIIHAAGADRDRAGAWLIDQSGGDGSGGFDVIRSMEPVAGDVRLIAGRAIVPASSFVPVGNWESSSGVMGMHTLRSAGGEPIYGARPGALVPGLSYESNVTNGGFNKNSIANRSYQGLLTSPSSDIPIDGVSAGKQDAYTSGEAAGDFDNAPGNVRDGPFINKADEGSQNTGSQTPYDWSRGMQETYLKSPTLFTPNRLIPSAVTLGSLPTGITANRPWQTLLFHPDPTGLHPGNRGRSGDGTSADGLPPDHLWLDLFTMPVVEPYAISEPLSTAGRLNMNYQIVPFTYIKRDTGIRAVLKSEKVIAIRDVDVARYKGRGAAAANARFDVSIEETLKGFENRFANHEIFRSATELCELPIVPAGATYLDVSSADSTFWKARRLTGDNSKERPYATIYPRVTTKSNTFTVHYRVQSLKKVKNTDPALWDAHRDQISGELRGSQTVERYVDPANSGIPDYTDPTVTTPLRDFYRFRVLQSKQFSP